MFRSPYLIDAQTGITMIRPFLFITTIVVLLTACSSGKTALKR